MVIEYTGWLKDTSKPDDKGEKSAELSPLPPPIFPRFTDNHGPRFDSSIGREDFCTEIGIGKLIRGEGAKGGISVDKKCTYG